MPLTYGPVGIAANSPAGFRIDEARRVIGRGDAAFATACAALRDWEHFKLGWVEVFPERASIAPGTVVAIVVRHLGFWSVNGCRVVYPIEPGADRRAFGFAYGTLASHAECGEEIFRVSLSPTNGDVTYEIRAVAKPRAFLARAAYPVTRAFQARFRRDSLRAMAKAVAGKDAARSSALR